MSFVRFKFFSSHGSLFDFQEGKAFDAKSKPIQLDEGKLNALKQANTVEKLWQAIGEDYWTVVPISSTQNPDQTLEGTRLTVVSLFTEINAWLSA